MFFVLSGFLITSLLIEEWDRRGGRISFRDFYARRALRLFPALGCVIAATVALAGLIALTGRPAERPYVLGTLDGLPWVMTFVGNWARALYPFSFLGSLGLLGHTWSLAVEEQFYLLWPALFVVLMRRRFSRGRLALSLALIAIAEMIYRLAGILAGCSNYRVYYGTDTHSDGLFIGCAIAFWLASHTSAPPYRAAGGLLKAATWMGMPALAILFVLGDRSGAPVEVSAAVLACGVVVMGIVAGEAPVVLERLLSSRHAVLIGRRSYGLYLWQYVILQAVVALFPPGLLGENRIVIAVTLGAVFVAPFIAAELSYRFVELPALRLKRRFREEVDSVRPLRGYGQEIPPIGRHAGQSADIGLRPAGSGTEGFASPDRGLP